MIPLFIRALPLSLGTLWHFVFLFPLVLAVSLPFLIVTIIPVISLPVVWAVMTFISFAGYRCALAAFGKGNEPSFIKLVKSSLIMGILVALSSLFMLALSAAIGTALGMVGIGEGFSAPTGVDIPYAAGVTGLIYMVLTSLFYICMAVPMTAVAHAATPRGRDADPFFGFGAGFFSLLIAWGLWFAGFVYLGFLQDLTETMAYWIALAVQQIIGIPVETPYAVDYVTMAIVVLYLMWGTCWYSAVAVLAWDRKISRSKRDKVEAATVPRVSAEDLRALREARMPGNREQM